MNECIGVMMIKVIYLRPGAVKLRLISQSSLITARPHCSQCRLL